MQRVKFRDPTRRRANPEGCPGCGAPHGQYHAFGCRLEPCPKCGGRILHCRCKALSRYDAICMASAVVESIVNKEETVRCLFSGTKGLTETYYGEGVLAWFVLAAQRTNADKIDRALAALGFTQAGDGYLVTPEALAKMLNIPIPEAAVLLEDLQAGFKGKLVVQDGQSKTGPSVN